QGSWTIGPQIVPGRGGIPGFANGYVTSFQATFVIYSGATTIHGTKQLGPPQGGEDVQVVAQCQEDAYGWVYTTTNGIDSKYSATIQGPSGSWVETGDAHTLDSDGTRCAPDSCPVISFPDFRETFITSTRNAVGPPATVTLNPPDAVNTVGTNHTVTATVTDS